VIGERVLQRVIVFSQGEASVAGLSDALGACGLQMLAVHSEAQLLDAVDQLSPECAVVFSSATMDSEVGRVAEEVRRIDHSCPLLVLTSGISAETAICAMRAGASDVLERNAPSSTIVARLRCLTGHHTGPPRLLAEGHELIGGHQLAGGSTGMRQIRSQIARVAAVDVSVLITGETGTGKELVAQLIHRNSRCSGRPFVALNCAAVPDSLLESELFGHERGAFTGAVASRHGKLQHASGGTLFLDEIGDMSLMAQAKILRAIENRVVQRLGSNTDTPVQVRLVAATNQDLEALTKEKRFREDLYYRLNVVRLELPPLRERLEDIPELVEHMVSEISQRHQVPVRRIEADLVRRFQGYHWPGNVREMRNVLESILVFSSSRSVGVADLPSNILRTLRSSGPTYGAERSKIVSVLKSADWNRNKAAKILCCSRMTLYRKMVKYSIPME
jgi:DNA-binding NtrC family response regulator